MHYAKWGKIKKKSTGRRPSNLLFEGVAQVFARVTTDIPKLSTEP